MDMGVTNQCIGFWSIVEREIQTVIPAHLKNLLRYVRVTLISMNCFNSENDFSPPTSICFPLF